MYLLVGLQGGYTIYLVVTCGRKLKWANVVKLHSLSQIDQVEVFSGFIFRLAVTKQHWTRHTAAGLSVYRPAYLKSIEPECQVCLGLVYCRDFWKGQLQFQSCSRHFICLTAAITVSWVVCALRAVWRRIVNERYLFMRKITNFNGIIRELFPLPLIESKSIGWQRT